MHCRTKCVKVEKARTSVLKKEKRKYFTSRPLIPCCLTTPLEFCFILFIFFFLIIWPFYSKRLKHLYLETDWITCGLMNNTKVMVSTLCGSNQMRSTKTTVYCLQLSVVRVTLSAERQFIEGKHACQRTEAEVPHLSLDIWQKDSILTYNDP